MPFWALFTLIGCGFGALLDVREEFRRRRASPLFECGLQPPPKLELCPCDRCKRMRGDKGWWDALPPEKRADLAIVDQVEGCRR